MSEDQDIEAPVTVPALFIATVLVTIGLILALIGYAVLSPKADRETDTTSSVSDTPDVDILIAESKGIRNQLPQTKGIAERNTLLNRRLEIVEQLSEYELSEQQENFCTISKLESLSMLNLKNLNVSIENRAERLRKLGSIAEDAFEMNDPEVKKTALIANELRLAQTVVLCPEYKPETTFAMLKKNTANLLEQFPNDPESVRSVVDSARILRRHDFEELATQLTNGYLSSARSNPELKELFADDVRVELLGEGDLAHFTQLLSTGDPQSLKRLEEVFEATGNMKDVPESVLSSISWLTESLLANPETVDLAADYAHKMKTTEPFKSSMGKTLTRLVEGLEKRAKKIGTSVVISGQRPSGDLWQASTSAAKNKPALLLFILVDGSSKSSVDFLLRQVDDMIANSNLDKSKFDIFIFGNEPLEPMEKLEKRLKRANVLMMKPGGPAEQLELSVFPYAVWIDKNQKVARMNIHPSQISRVATEEISSTQNALATP